MNLEIKKDLTSSWFKTLQNAICNSIEELENNKTKFRSNSWKRNLKKDEGGGEYRILSNGKILRKLELTFQRFMENFQTNLKKIFLGRKRIPDFGHQGYL